MVTRAHSLHGETHITAVNISAMHAARVMHPARISVLSSSLFRGSVVLVNQNQN